MKRSQRIIATGILTAILFLLLPVGQAVGARLGDKLHNVLETSGPDEEIPVIITFKNQVDFRTIRDKTRSKRRAKIKRALKNRADASVRTIRSLLTRHGKARKMRQLWLINGLSVSLPKSLVKIIADQPMVDRIVLDQIIELHETNYSSTATSSWNISTVGAPELWLQGVTGQGVVVGSMDTGVDLLHPDIAANYRGGSNSWYDPFEENSTPHDVNGHGTQTMGIMIGGQASGQPIGMAPDARWIAAKIFDNMGQTTLSAIHLGFQWMLDPDGNPDIDDAPDMVNNSWGLQETVGECSVEFAADVAALRAAGIAVVFSAGNAGPFENSSQSPANNTGSTAVGSVDESLEVDTASARGPSACDGDLYPQVVAPGVNIYTADLTYDGLVPNSYDTVSGTSFAAPHLTGGLALLKSALPEISVDQLEMAIQFTAADLGVSGPDNDFGEGLLDVGAAYDFLAADLVDNDGDGYLSSLDCDDFDGSIYPGAPDVPYDGIDQDCNGYDLAMIIMKAVYQQSEQKLVVHAGSDLGAAANLELFIQLDTGDVLSGRPMIWNEVKNRWQWIKLGFENEFNGLPVLVTAKGPEGSVAAVVLYDNDGDGFGILDDCNDSDAAVYPGAPEIKHDGIDQDCNGYDLTIDITRAKYLVAEQKMIVHATSDLAEQADLQLIIELVTGEILKARPMFWKAGKSRWQWIKIGFEDKFVDPPYAVTVSGPEGSVSGLVRIRE